MEPARKKGDLQKISLFNCRINIQAHGDSEYQWSIDNAHARTKGPFCWIFKGAVSDDQPISSAVDKPDVSCESAELIKEDPCLQHASINQGNADDCTSQSKSLTPKQLINRPGFEGFKNTMELRERLLHLGLACRAGDGGWQPTEVGENLGIEKAVNKNSYCRFRFEMLDYIRVAMGMGSADDD